MLWRTRGESDDARFSGTRPTRHAMPITTVVHCSVPECREPAAYKIAAPWSDGSFSELKTYGHACTEHLGTVFRDSEQRRRSYSCTPGETIEEIGIFRYEQGKRDKQLQRLFGLEENYRTPKG